MDFLVLSSLLLLHIEPQRVALLPKFPCVFAIMSLGRFLEVGCGSENRRISSSAPGIALVPLRSLSRFESPPALLESACIVTLTRRLCCQNVGFLLVCWARNCVSILICISFIMRRLEIVSCLLRALAFFFCDFPCLLPALLLSWWSFSFLY